MIFLSLPVLALGLSPLGCAEAEISLSPSALDFGVVDFNSEPLDCNPEEGGCSPSSFTVQNTGEVEVSVVGIGWQNEYLCADGFSPGELDIGMLRPGNSFTLEFAVCGKDPGYGVELSGSILFTPSEGESQNLSWSFTPERDIGGDDTGG